MYPRFINFLKVLIIRVRFSLKNQISYNMITLIWLTMKWKRNRLLMLIDRVLNPPPQ